MLKVVFDTNVFVSALIFPKGTVGSLFKFAQKYKLIVSLPLLEEIVQVLTHPKISKKYEIDPGMIQEMLIILKEDSFLASPKKKITILSDSMDNHLLSLAKESKADFLVTGDKEILSLKKIDSTKVLSPFQFLQILKTK